MFDIPLEDLGDGWLPDNPAPRTEGEDIEALEAVHRVQQQVDTPIEEDPVVKKIRERAQAKRGVDDFIARTVMLDPNFTGLVLDGPQFENRKSELPVELL